MNKEKCEHPFTRLHWVGTTVFCNACGKSLNKDTTKVTRLEVIDKTGRAYTNWHKDNSIAFDLQDDNRTLKVFITRDIKL